MRALEIIACGPHTSIQDSGRFGHADIGLACAGAMDPRALAIANALAGNDSDEAVIELALMGLVARVIGGPVRVALAGGHAAMQVDGKEVETHASVIAAAGATIEVGRITRGVYAVLAVGGGFDIAAVLGSRSFDARARLGGFRGRPIEAGDRLDLRLDRQIDLPRLWAETIAFDGEAPIRVVLGPQADAFSERGLQTLIGMEFTVSTAIDRMAYRLTGPVIERLSGFEMISEGTLSGSIQVPPDGHPLVLMADRQTIGGYPKIATAISADLARLAQRRPGEAVRFVAVSVEEAREIAAQQRAVGISVYEGERAGRGSTQLDHERLANLADAVVDAADQRSWDIGAGARG